MSAFDTATFLLFPGIGLICLALALLVRRYSASALAVGLTGLLTLTAASTWIAAARPMVNETQRNSLTAPDDALKYAMERLKVDNAHKLKAEQQGRVYAERRAMSAESQAEALTAKYADLERALRKMEKAETEAKRNSSFQIRRLSNSVAEIKKLNEAIRKANEGKREALSRVAALEKQLQSSRVAPPAPSMPDAAAIRRKLETPNSHYFVLKKDQALIAGRKGEWYVVRLLRAGGEWQFADRQFALPDASELKANAKRFRTDILAPLSRTGKRWTLFVRGSADGRRVAGPVRRVLPYLPLLPNGTYSPKATSKRLAIPVQNEHLPMLRADWLRKIVQSALSPMKATDIAILENPPQPGNSRMAELVMVVEW